MDRGLFHYAISPPVIRTLLSKLLSLILFIWNSIGTITMSFLFWEQWLFYLQSLTYRILFLPLSSLFIYLSPILLGMLYILLSRQNSLGKLILPTTLAFYVEMRYFSGKKTLNNSIYKNSNNYRMRVLLSNKRKRITKIKKITTFTKQIKQETRTIIVTMSIR